jgi:multidrug efflux pump subunit AcrA (membrane-fusion protein)
MAFPGIVTELRVTPGQSVKKGDIICRYAINRGKAIEIGRELLFNEIDELDGNIASTEFKLLNLQKNEKELSKLTEEKLSPQSALDALRNELQLTRAYLALLKKQAANARLFAEKTLQHFRELLGDDTLTSGRIPDIVNVKAPIPGVILNLHPLLKKDGLLPEGEAIAQVGTMDTMSVRSLVYERDVVHLTPGMTVRFFPDSLPGKVFPATVATIDRTPNVSSPDAPSYYNVEMTIENDQLELREGFKGRVECTAPGK